MAIDVANANECRGRDVLQSKNQPAKTASVRVLFRGAAGLGWPRTLFSSFLHTPAVQQLSDLHRIERLYNSMASVKAIVGVLLLALAFSVNGTFCFWLLLPRLLPRSGGINFPCVNTEIS